MRISKTLLSLSAMALSLTACKSLMDPTFLPSGYTHHQKDYKSPHADAPWSIGYDYTHAQNADIVGKWRVVASDIVTKLEATELLAKTSVFLSSPTLDNAFTLSLDNALREELRSRGHYLVSVPDMESLKLQVSTYDPEFKDAIQSYEFNDIEEGNPEPPKLVNKDMVIKVDGLIVNAPVTLVESTYNLPLYGYQDRQLYFPLTQSLAEVWR